MHQMSITILIRIVIYVVILALKEKNTSSKPSNRKSSMIARKTWTNWSQTKQNLMLTEIKLDKSINMRTSVYPMTIELSNENWGI